MNTLKTTAFPYQLFFSALVLLQVIAIRDEYLENGRLGWMSTACFLLVILTASLIKFGAFSKSINQREKAFVEDERPMNK
ncbi:MAG: hypothetical protein ABIU63_15090 [Chitinophagaceae bacterium]